MFTFMCVCVCVCSAYARVSIAIKVDGKAKEHWENAGLYFSVHGNYKHDVDCD